MKKTGFEVAVLAGCVALCLACSSEEPAPSGPSCSAPGGPATGPADTTHCVANGTRVVQATSAAACDGGGSEEDENEVAGDAGAFSPYGAPFFGTQSADDQCKYDVTFSTSELCVNDSVSVRAVVKSRADNTPVTGAGARVEAFLTETHPARNPGGGRSTREDPPGTYTVGPIAFDASGRWTVRWHFFEDCLDEPAQSPHGHVSFYVDVP